MPQRRSFYFGLYSTALTGRLADRNIFVIFFVQITADRILSSNESLISFVMCDIDRIDGHCICIRIREFDIVSRRFAECRL